jgi:hypothetical protein
MVDQNIQLGQLFAAYWRALARLENELGIPNKTLEEQFPITKLYTKFWPPTNNSEETIYQYIKHAQE